MGYNEMLRRENMTQEKLLEIYHSKDHDIMNRYYKADKYFKTAKEFYADLQDGKATEKNFFENTIVIYNETKKPKGDPDFVSDSGSRYWYSKEGVTRGSNHWGDGVANCDWALKRKDGKMIYGVSLKSPKNFNKELFGFAKWEDYIFKAQLVTIGKKEYVRTFKNAVGRELTKIDKKVYERKFIEVFEEVK